MKTLTFKKSNDLTIGIELEYQIVHPISCNLISRAKELIRDVKGTKFEEIIKPEVTQSMLEINSSVHTSSKNLYRELMQIRNFLVSESKKLNIQFCGAGTHPFQKWVERKIFPSKRFRHLSKRYQYLMKRSTVFGQHVHVGCSTVESALRLCHGLGRYVPQLIAISASSPFYQGIDTGFDSARLTIFNNFPTTGTFIPLIYDWDDFSAYFFKMQQAGVIETMKDFYWDIRPKPEFGTVEIRVCDVPLTLRKAVIIGTFIQTLSHFILNEEKTVKVSEDLYDLYNFNRFQSARYGLTGKFIDPDGFKEYTILEDFLKTIQKIMPSAKALGTTSYLNELKREVQKKGNDATFLRQILTKTGSLKEVVRQQCKSWLQ